MITKWLGTFIEQFSCFVCLFLCVCCCVFVCACVFCRFVLFCFLDRQANGILVLQGESYKHTSRATTEPRYIWHIPSLEVLYSDVNTSKYIEIKLHYLLPPPPPPQLPLTHPPLLEISRSSSSSELEHFCVFLMGVVLQLRPVLRNISSSCSELEHFRVFLIGVVLQLRPGAGIMEADDRQVTTAFTVQRSFHHRHSTNRASWSVTIVGERAVTPHLVVRRRR